MAKEKLFTNKDSPTIRLLALTLSTKMGSNFYEQLIKKQINNIYYETVN